MRHKFIVIFFIIKFLGIKWLIYRIWYFIKIKTGLLKLTAKPVKWDKYVLSRIVANRNYQNATDYKNYRMSLVNRFFFEPNDRNKYLAYLEKWKDSHLLDRISDIYEGRFQIFSKLILQTEIPPDWHLNNITKYRSPIHTHWSSISDFKGGDIKIVWELNRFAFVYDLVRIYWRTGDEKYAELFWELIGNWKDNNPPNKGVNWKCGQETTFRTMAWCWGYYGFFNSRHSTPDKIAMLTGMIYFSGERIEKNIGYALNQRNNHSLSEAVGLWTIGILFPELKKSNRWRERGKKLIQKLIPELFNDEGVFTQNSFNYHRLALHDLIWAFRLSEINNDGFNEDIHGRFRKAADVLYKMQDDTTGFLPNYGANDGALILPLSSCDYRDYRPVLQSSFYFFDKKRVYSEGPWDEDLLWLFGPDSLQSMIRGGTKEDLNLEDTGYYIIRSPRGFLFTRCGKHIYRPGQGDMLHVDIWYDGHNIAIDPGSYSYNAPPPWDNGFGPTSYHNTVTVDDRNQMDTYGKFLVFPWVNGKLVYRSENKTTGYKYFECTHDAYDRLDDPVRYVRAILKINDEIWLVIDKLSGNEAHKYRLQWLLKNCRHDWDDGSRRLTLFPDDKEYSIRYGSFGQILKTSLISADNNSPRGWWSPYYFYKEPALSLEMEEYANTATLYTIFGPDKLDMQISNNCIRVQSEENMYNCVVNTGKNKNRIISSFHNI
jgi:hypothetical protein